MRKYQDRFQPEDVDEQVEQMLAGTTGGVDSRPDTSSLDTSFMQALADMRQSTTQDQQSIERTWMRIAGQMDERVGGFHEPVSVLRPSSPKRVFRRRSWQQHLNVLVASIIVVVLVGSSLLVLNVMRQSQMGALRETVTSTPTPTFSQNVVPLSKYIGDVELGMTAEEVRNTPGLTRMENVVSKDGGSYQYYPTIGLTLSFQSIVEEGVSPDQIKVTRIEIQPGEDMIGWETSEGFALGMTYESFIAIYQAYQPISKYMTEVPETASPTEKARDRFIETPTPSLPADVTPTPAMTPTKVGITCVSDLTGTTLCASFNSKGQAELIILESHV